MGATETFNLFVYGTLAYDRYMRAITGRIFPKRPCVLDDYALYSPPEGYRYIIPRAGSRVSGYLIEGVTREHLAQLDSYEAEGEMYLRREVRLSLGGREIPAYAYLANEEMLKRYFGAERPGRERLFLSKMLDGIIARTCASGGLPPAPLDISAVKELLGGRVEEMLASPAHFTHLSREELARALFSPGMPTFEAVRLNPELRPHADAYLRLAIRHIILSRLEEKMGEQFRETVRPRENFYPRGTSMLLALVFANAHAADMERLIAAAGCAGFRDEMEYPDCARAAVAIAERLFDRSEAALIRRRIDEEREPGATPLGAELEFSPLGRGAIGARPGEDPVYDGFYYFHDFDLMRRGWKLGMYVDNHKATILPGERTRGFLEYALGRWSIPGDFSKPVTDDPRLLARLVTEAARFCGIRPHSLHLSIQIPPDAPYGSIERASDLFCLLLLLGDVGPDEGGRTRELRIFNREIEDERGGIYFSKENIHSGSAEARSRVMEYQFPRLSVERDYAPCITVLKGFQLAGNPAPVNPFMEGSDYRPDHPLLRALADWAAAPRALAEREIGAFLNRVEGGLNAERDGAPAHSRSFIASALAAAGRALRDANRRLAG